MSKGPIKIKQKVHNIEQVKYLIDEWLVTHPHVAGDGEAVSIKAFTTPSGWQVELYYYEWEQS